MSKTKENSIFSHLKQDLPASVVVFLVAMPLCLGIALASGAPLFSGLIAGIIGGIIVGSLSGSPLGVSGPAAGLAVIVLSAIQDLGSFEIFLCAIVIAGVLQIIMGFVKAGVIAYYFPSSVITGMLSGIGIVIFLKQIPHAFGYDKDFEGDLAFMQPDSQNTFSELVNMLDYISPGALLVSSISLAILILWESPFLKKHKIFNLIQGPLVAVVVSILLNVLLQGHSTFSISSEHLVQIPLAGSISDFFGNFSFPDFSGLGSFLVYKTAFVIAIVGSLETLLCVEATDKQDPKRRVTPTNRELKAQGIGNVISGLIGGLPITQVIVRSSVNMQAGGQTKLSAIIHGFIILFSVILIPGILNLIPLASLAAILFVVGYKLAKPAVFKKMYSQGWEQFFPFIATILGIVFTDLLVGIGIGLCFAIFFILLNNYNTPVTVVEPSDDGSHDYLVSLPSDLSFFKKASLLRILKKVDKCRSLKIDATQNRFMHQDIIDILSDFIINAREREIQVDLVGFNDKHLDQMQV